MLNAHPFFSFSDEKLCRDVAESAKIAENAKNHRNCSAKLFGDIVIPFVFGEFLISILVLSTDQ
jgi:hypothetical protein